MSTLTGCRNSTTTLAEHGVLDVSRQGRFLVLLFSALFVSFYSDCTEGRGNSSLNMSSDLIGEFAPTFYRTLDEGSAEWPAEERTEELRTRSGSLIARVAPAFKRQLDIEGSARLSDGRVVNFDEKVQGRWTYLVATDAPYGLDALGHKLIPYRTIAVDPDVIELGTVVYIPALDGIRLPSGEIHDGLCLAQDTGQGIEGACIDVFVGFENDVDNTLTRSGKIVNMRPLRLYRVDSERTRRFLSRLNEPSKDQNR
jgi:3D (Asp-Asp-Asp) domain-containing protein